MIITSGQYHEPTPPSQNRPRHHMELLREHKKIKLVNRAA